MKYDTDLGSSGKFGIKVDAVAIADGLFGMMSEDDLTLIAFGMISKPIVDTLEKLLSEKFDQLVEKSYGEKPEWLDAYVTSLGLGAVADAQEARKAFVRTVSKEVCTALHGVAKRAGKMVV